MGLIFLGVVSLTGLLCFSGALNLMNKKLTHGLYKGRDVSEKIVIVAVDDESLRSTEEGGLGRSSDWPYTHLAEAILQLRKGGSHSIFLDFLMTSPSSGVTSDKLVEAILSSKSSEELIQNLSPYVAEIHPDDQAFSEALGPDVFMLEHEGAKSLGIFRDQAQTAFTQLDPLGNEAAIYSVGVSEEMLAVKLVRDYLYRNQRTEGVFEGKTYRFDEERNIPLVEGDQMLINYAAPSYSFKMISFVDVLNGDFEASEVEGKMVLIGATAPILQDRHFTPIDPNVPMPGVEIQANAIQTILDGAFLKHQSFWGFLAMVSGMVAVSVLVFVLAPVWVGAAWLALEVAAFPFFAQFMFNRGVIVNLVWPNFALAVAYLASLAYRYLTEFKDRRKIQAAFGHYVSPALVGEIVKNPDVLKLGGERRNISVLFLDFENFTQLSESLEPREVVELVNLYFGALAGVIMDHGGTVDKFEGDAIMALFGAPLAHPDHALRACETALALCDKMRELDKNCAIDLKWRIGIASGDCIVGNMGSEERFDYTAMGDTVNTASRLEGGNKFYGTQILVNPGAMEGARERLRFRRVDRVRFKGKTEALDVYEILGRVGAEGPADLAFLSDWDAALEHYRAGRWDEAEVGLRAFLTKRPGDEAAQVYLERVAVLKANPPEAWDGVWKFEVK